MELLEGLPLLTELPRGDFLCDALVWLDETDPERCSRFFRCFFCQRLDDKNDLPFWPTRSLSKAPTGHLRVLGKRGLLLPPFRAAALGLHRVSKHPENAFHVSVSSFYVLSKKNRWNSIFSDVALFHHHQFLNQQCFFMLWRRKISETFSPLSNTEAAFRDLLAFTCLQVRIY